MYTKNRDNIISIRVSTELLQKAQNIIDSHTSTYTMRGGRTGYYTRIPNKKPSYEKYTMADLFEDALKKFIEETLSNSPGAK